MQPTLRRLAEKHAHLPDHRESLIDDVVEVFLEATQSQMDQRVEGLLACYLAAGKFAQEIARRPRVLTDAPFGFSKDEFGSPDILRYLQEEAGKRVRGIDHTTLKALRKTLGEAYQKGEGWAKWVGRVKRVVDCSKPKNRADMIVRTELAFAYNAVLLRTYREMGVTHVQWLSVLDKQTCPRCRDRHEQIFRLDEVEGQIPLHPRCLPGDARVSAEGISAASKRWFDGDLVVICTASGKNLSCTPNHPILTDGGWVAAALLNVGGNVISSGAAEWHPAKVGDDKDVPPTIHEVAEAFGRAPHRSARPVPVAPEDFHGDGEGSEVAVVWTDGLLSDRRDAESVEAGGQLHLRRGNMESLRLNGLRAQALLLQCLHPGPGCLVGSLCQAITVLGAGARHPVGHRLTPVARGKTSFAQAQRDDVTSNAVVGSNRLDRFAFGKPLHDLSFRQHNPSLEVRRGLPVAFDIHTSGAESSANDAAVDAELARKILSGAAGPVFTDQVVSVKFARFAGHVYNLQTRDGFYVANGIITHNCRCTIVAAPPDKYEVPDYDRYMNIPEEEEVAQAVPFEYTGFDWDDGNIEHATQHGVSQDEIEEAVRRSQGFIAINPKGGEPRWQIYGDAGGRNVTVKFTQRGEKGELVRPISATPEAAMPKPMKRKLRGK
jgi:SPP1 gp7 family putative phage head morphogenesis protein